MSEDTPTKRKVTWNVYSVVRSFFIGLLTVFFSPITAVSDFVTATRKKEGSLENAWDHTEPGRGFSRPHRYAALASSAVVGILTLGILAPSLIAARVGGSIPGLDKAANFLMNPAGGAFPSTVVAFFTAYAFIVAASLLARAVAGGIGATLDTAKANRDMGGKKVGFFSFESVKMFFTSLGRMIQNVWESPSLRATLRVEQRILKDPLNRISYDYQSASRGHSERQTPGEDSQLFDAPKDEDEEANQEKPEEKRNEEDSQEKPKEEGNKEEEDEEEEDEEGGKEESQEGSESEGDKPSPRG